MTTKTAPKPTDAPATDAPANPYASLLADLGGFKPLKATPTKVKPTSATDWRRTIDLAIITAAGNLVTELVPEEMRDDVAKLIANQLHHLSTPALGWPSEVLPQPERSDWR
jgi:hypothetical protein